MNNSPCQNFFKVMNTKVCVFLCLLAPFVFAHEGEPSHGGDLPVDLGGSRLQYKGRQNLVDISVQESAFHPSAVTINIGGVVAFQNEDDTEHKLVFKTGEGGDGEEHDHPVGGGHERSGVIKPGKYWLLEFLVPGLYPYTCSIHGESGQVNVNY
jgi:plastocyanin